jgi:hypothetical protein
MNLDSTLLIVLIGQQLGVAIYPDPRKTEEQILLLSRLWIQPSTQQQLLVFEGGEMIAERFLSSRTELARSSFHKSRT